MSYKTNAIGNRLGISFGWNSDIYPSFQLHNYGSTVQNSIKLYFFVKEYLNKKNIMLITYNYSKRDTNYSLFLNIYRYQRSFNANKKNYTRTKKKLIKSIQSDIVTYRKRTKKRFVYKWKRGYKKLRTNVGWRSLNRKDLVSKLGLFKEQKQKREDTWRRIVQKNKKLAKTKNFLKIRKRRRRNRIKGWNFLTKKLNRFLIINRFVNKNNTGIFSDSRWKLEFERFNKLKKLRKLNVRIKKFQKLNRKLEGLNKLNIKKKITMLKKLKGGLKVSRVNVIKYRVLKQNIRNKYLELYKNKNRVRVFHPEFYNNYISILALRFKLRLFLRSKNFCVTNINISEPIKVANKKSIKFYSRSHWYRQVRKQKFFINTIRLLHLMERFPNPAILADHFARELLKIRKKHWNLIRAFSTILKYWRFHNASLLNRREAQRNKGRDPNTKQIKAKRWIPRYKLYSKHDKKKAIRGIKINIKGKINAADRTRLKTIQEGIIPIQSFNKNVTYALAHARVKTGAFGIKVWLFT